MYCLIWRDSVMILLVCYDRYNPLHYVYARLRQVGTSVWQLRQVGTSVWHIRVMVWAPATFCGSLLLLVLLELCYLGGLKVEMVLRVGMFQRLP